MAVLLGLSAVAAANTVTISGSMEGNISIANGDWVAAGYQFTIPGSHPTTHVLIANAKVTITGACSNGGTGTLTIPLSPGPAGSTYLVPAGSSSWYPLGAEGDPATYQGSVQASVCGGTGTLNASAGAVFTADVQADQAVTINIRFHYRDPNAKGQGNVNCQTAPQQPAAVCGASWSGTKSVTPTPFSPGFTIQKLQRLSPSDSYTTSALTGSPGQTVYYKMVVTNTGTTDLTFSAFTDAHCDSGTIAGGPGSNPVAAGASTTYTCSHVLTNADQTAGSYSNNATVTGTPPTGAGSPSTQTSNTVVVNLTNAPTPGFTIQKLQMIDGSGGSFTTDTLTGSVGQKVNYQIILTNTGNTALTFSAFTDAHCDSGTIAGGPGSNPVAAGASTTYTCSHVLTNADQTAGSYSNNATVTGTPPGGGPITQTSNTVVVNLTSPVTPGFMIQKLQMIDGSGGSFTTDTLTGSVGQKVDYQMIVTNTGNTALTFSAFTDTHCDSGTIAGGPGSNPVAAGASTTYTCSHVLTNADQTAGSYSNNATVTGTPPGGGPITQTSNTVVVNLSSPAFTILKQQRIAGSGKENPNDQITVQKQEGFIAQLNAGETRTATIACPAGYQVLDGSALIQHVDQGAGSTADVQVLQSESTSTSAYTFTVYNPTRGQAEVQGFVTCVLSHTTDGGVITVTDPPVTQTVSFAAGTTTQTLACPAGYAAVDPGWHFTSGTGVVTASQPSGDGSKWTFTISGAAAGSVDLSIRCLNLKTSDGDQLQTQELFKTVTVPAGQTVTAQITCPVGYKGVVASYNLPAGLVLLGDEPQPVTRVFTLQNTTGSDQTATLDLLCLKNNTTSGGASAWVTDPLIASVGQTVEYQIIVTNTGNVPLTFSDFTDAGCDAGTLAGGPGSSQVPPGGSTVWTCSHKLTSLPFSNTATVTGTPTGGGPITHDSNMVVAQAAATQVVVRAAQHGPKVSAQLKVTKRNSRVQMEVYAPAAQLATAAAKKPPKLVLLGRVVRTHASGRVKITVVLNKKGKQALKRHHHLTVKVLITVKPPNGKAQQITRIVTLRS